MKVFAIIPVNRLSIAKSRLSGFLSPEERRELVLCMLKDVLNSLADVEVIIVSPDPIKDLISGYSFIFLHEKKEGLNPAVAQANRFAIEEGADATLFVPGDVPLITREHVKRILSLGKTYSVIISPASRGGTGILFRKPPNAIRERFTSQSFSDHLKEARSKGIEPYIYESRELALDIDTPEDIEEFLKVGKGTKTYEFLTYSMQEFY
jgi:2-phospho-L-lactate guanylyltransferase